MSDDPSKPDWWAQILKSARRNVRQLEIDACRIRTDLARLEAANAVENVDGDIASLFQDDEIDRHHEDAPPKEPTAINVDSAPANGAPKNAIDWRSASESNPEGMEILVAATSPEITAHLDATEISPTVGSINRSRNLYRRATPSGVASLTFHCAILMLMLSITVGKLEPDDSRFLTATLELGKAPVTELEKLEPPHPADLGDAALEKSLVDSARGGPQFDSVGKLDHDVVPIELPRLDTAVLPARAGLSTPMLSDLGKFSPGAGGENAGGKGAAGGTGNGSVRARAETPRKSTRQDTTLFFGTEARGNRFVFVVDNSSSMKGGRLERATAELVKTVDGLTPRQSFYVIFVSDQTYPMFYPQREPNLVPATPANKKRLAEWAPKAILASGKNRELMKAMDLAIELRPQAVYLLWDGDLRYSEKVRLDVMTHLTQPGQNFIVHTLGMGITSLDSEQNLRMIAQAHGGTYRRVDVPTGRAR
jgi:hypothetical protein